MTEYVHGYSEREALRLSEQAETLEKLLHHDTVYPPGAKVLEAGCGIGAQTVILAKNNPDAEITSIDISPPESLEKARENTEKMGLKMLNSCRQIFFLFLLRTAVLTTFLSVSCLSTCKALKKP